jgi:hypothetical protein
MEIRLIPLFNPTRVSVEEFENIALNLPVLLNRQRDCAVDWRDYLRSVSPVQFVPVVVLGVM